MKKKILAVILAVIMAVSPVAVLAEGNAQYNLINALKTYIDTNYKYEMDDELVLDLVLKTALEKNPELFEDFASILMDNLDEHSKYYTQEEFQEFYAYVESEYYGIGAYLSSEGKYCVITGFLKDSPAQKAGLLEGDKIIKIDGEEVGGLDADQTASKARGEVGTTVQITVLRGDEELEFNIVRAALNETTVNYTLLEENVGYIEIVSFNSVTGGEFYDALCDLKANGADKFIVDLRNNVGGVTSQALEAASYLVPKDKALLKVSNKKTGDYTYYNPTDGKIEDLVVLVNGYTASAAEIFTAAIKDNNAGVIMGTGTYGKGTMQNTLNLGAYGGIKLTVSEFFTPNGDQINKKGIAPDEYVVNVKRLATADDFEPLTFENKYYLGDSHPQIAALKQRLRALGYFGGDLDEYFDATLDAAVKRFQTDTKLYPCGDLDFTTQTFINNLVLEAEVMEDTQFNTAYEYLTK